MRPVYLLLAAAGLFTAPPKFDPEKLPYRAAWGSFTVLAEKAGSEEFSPQRARILDSQGQLQREVRDERIADVSYPTLARKGPDLRVDGFSGGAHCCSTTYFFTQEGGLRNVLIFDGNNGGINAVKDLNGDGRAEIIASSDALAYFGGLPYAASPWLIMVIGWDGTRYADQTKRFPERSLKQAAQYRKDFLAALRQKGDTAEDMRRLAAAGYYANSLAAGKGPAEWSWLTAHAPAGTRKWLLKNRKDLLATPAISAGKLRVSQEKILQPPQP